MIQISISIYTHTRYMNTHSDTHIHKQPMRQQQKEIYKQK